MPHGSPARGHAPPSVERYAVSFASQRRVVASHAEESEGWKMSWVSEVWSTTPIIVDGRLPQLDGRGWRQDGPQDASYDGSEWLITVEPLREDDWLWGEVPLACVGCCRRRVPACSSTSSRSARRRPHNRMLAQTVATLMLDQEAVCWNQDEIALSRAQFVDREGISEAGDDGPLRLSSQWQRRTPWPA